MEGEQPQSEVNSRRKKNVVFPVEIEQPLPSNSAAETIEHREMKHFRKWFPWLIPTFVIVNVIVFIITMYVNNCPENSMSCIAKFLGRFSFQPFSQNPLLGPSPLALEQMGALDVTQVVRGQREVWRLFTCIWLHGGLFHLLTNMLGILVVGIRLEQEFGFVLIGSLFVISGFGGSLLSALFIRNNIAVGASGALFGLLGGMLSELITNWSIYDRKIGALFTLVFVIVINLAMGLLPHVDNFAHIGGFLSGFLLGFVFLIRPQFGWVKQQYAPQGISPPSVKSKFKKYQCMLWILSLILLIVGYIIGMVSLLRGINANHYCSWCHYLSCLPTSRWQCNAKPQYCSIDMIGSQLKVTCDSNGVSSLYNLPYPTNFQLHQFCLQLCG